MKDKIPKIARERIAEIIKQERFELKHLLRQRRELLHKLAISKKEINCLKKQMYAKIESESFKRGAELAMEIIRSEYERTDRGQVQ